LGIKPTLPETGYGYIQLAAVPPQGASTAVDVIKFVEKPNAQLAQQFLKAGTYCWNAGIFIFNAKFMIKMYQTHQPQMWEAMSGLKSDFSNLTSIYEKLQSISIDYAIMERTDIGAMVPLAAGWDDLGSWEALWQVGPKDELQNVVKGDVVLQDVSDSYLHAESRLYLVFEFLDLDLKRLMDAAADATGLSRDAVRRRCVDEVAATYTDAGWWELGRVDCALHGPAGNREIWLWLAAGDVRSVGDEQIVT
jgi:mannose-1-phosphate guanylyltransferase